MFLFASMILNVPLIKLLVAFSKYVFGAVGSRWESSGEAHTDAGITFLIVEGKDPC